MSSSFKIDTMGDSLEKYRQRIGCFGPGRGWKQSRDGPESVYRSRNRYRGRPDINFRLLATLIVIGSILLCCRFSMDYRDLTLNNIVKYYSAGCYEPNTWCNSMLLHGCSSSVDMSMVDNQYVGFSSQLLLLSADIEWNPGPISVVRAIFLRQ